MPAADMNSTRLATLIADRLNAVVPETFTVSEANGVVGITSSKVWWGAQSHVATLADQPDGETSASLETAAWNALSAVLDYISEVEKEMWPGGADYGSPYVAVENGALRLWYGPR